MDLFSQTLHPGGDLRLSGFDRQRRHQVLQDHGARWPDIKKAACGGFAFMHPEAAEY